MVKAARPVAALDRPDMIRGISVRDALDLSSLAGVEVLAGEAGLDRMIRFVNIMEVPDVLPWTRADELLLTTGYPLRATPESLDELVGELHRKGLAGIAIKLGRYIDQLPPVMLAVADRRGFPVLQIPDGVGFDEILNQILSEVLGRQAAVLARGAQAHNELLQIVLHGGGLPEVLQALPRQLGGAEQIALLHIDRSGRVTVRAGAELPDCADELFDQDGLFRATAFRHGVHTVGTASVLVASVVAAEDQGDLVAICTDAGWDAQDVITLERGATVAALVVTRELAVAAVEGKYRGDFLREVLSGRVAPDAAAAGAKGFGWELTGPMVVVVAAGASATVDESVRRRRAEQLAGSWASWVRRWDPAAAAATFAAEAVAVLHTADASVPESNKIAELMGGLSSPGVPFDGLLGVSRVVPDAGGLPPAYAQAWEAVRVGRRLSGSGTVARFDDLGLYRLLSLVPDSTELRAFLTDTLGTLAEPEGDVESDELRRTLQVLLDTNLNVAQTARRLHFHYNTLRYRIGKLERLLGPFTTDARLRADLTVALHVWQMRVAHD